LDVLEAIPAEDTPTAELVREGRTIGCFQIESPGMRATLKEIQASNMDDLMVALALYRPGPLTGGLKGAFVRRHRGEEQATYLHPKLEPLLRDTYGVILYQEQVLQIAHELAGLSLVDSDLLRRAMSHFDPGKQMATLKEKFITGAATRSSVPEDVAEQVWELMAAFAGYGFPKAHAASYAQVAWRSAWCKAHYPALFMAGVLANWGGYYGQQVYLMEARRMGLKIRPPNVNYAAREFSLSYLDGEAVLFMGFDQVRDLTKRTQKRIVRERPFHSLPDFLTRVDPRVVEAENLAKVGALRDFDTIPSLLHQLEGGGWRGGQLSLFSLAGDEQDDWSLEERVAAQEAFLGVGVDAHRLELVADEITAAGALNTVDAASKVGQRTRVAGMRQIWRRFTNYRGERVYYMSLEDLEGMIDVDISASVYRRSKDELVGRGPYIVEGMIELDERSGEPFIRAEGILGIR
jgi:DNA polymerase III alpha subunit